MVVGAESVVSRVRRWILQEAMALPDTLLTAIVNFTISFSAEQAMFLEDRLHPLVGIGIHPNCTYIRVNILKVPNARQPQAWIF